MGPLDFEKSFPVTSACACKRHMTLNLLFESPVYLIFSVIRYRPVATKHSEIIGQFLENLSIVCLMYIWQEVSDSTADSALQSVTCMTLRITYNSYNKRYNLHQIAVVTTSSTCMLHKSNFICYLSPLLHCSNTGKPEVWKCTEPPVCWEKYAAVGNLLHLTTRTLEVKDGYTDISKIN
jgi:hypothetical protein